MEHSPSTKPILGDEPSGPTDAPAERAKTAEEPQLTEHGFLSLTQFRLLVGLSYSAYKSLRAKGLTPPEIRLSRRTIRFRRATVEAWASGIQGRLTCSQGTTRPLAKGGDSAPPTRTSGTEWVWPFATHKAHPQAVNAPAPVRFASPGGAAAYRPERREILVPIAEFLNVAGLTEEDYALLQATNKGPRVMARVWEEVFVTMEDLHQWMERHRRTPNAAPSTPT